MKQKNTLFKLVFLFFILLTVNSAFAQQTEKVEITGVVTDETTGKTLPGATVLEKNTTNGTSSDINGKYKIEVNKGATIVFSFIGMDTEEKVVGNQTVINIAMIPSLESLQEVVVIGYGTQKKKDKTGSIVTINTKDFDRGSITSPDQLLVGKTAGVQITSNGGAPGAGATIRIRGGSSLNASNDPLFVIDGIPVDNTGISGMRNPLNVINPNDIATFTVLKDASATAIYGSRASNGVIIITTKKGKIGSALKVNYSGKTSINTIPKTTDVLSSKEFRSIIQQRINEGKLPDTAASFMGTANTNWQNQIYQTAVGQDHDISVTGAYKNLPFRASAGYSDQNGILKTDNMKRMTGAISLNPKFFDDHLNFNLNLKGMNSKNIFANRAAIGSAVAFDPTQPIKDPTSPYGGYFTWTTPEGFPNGLAPSNPVALLNLRQDKSTVNRLIGNLQTDYRFSFLPELRANLNVGFDKSKSDGNYSVPDYASWAFNTDSTKDGGTIGKYNQEKNNEILEFYLNYVKNVESIASKFDVMAGYSWQHFWRKNYSFETNDFTSIDKKIIVKDNEDKTENYLVSFFGRFNYTLLDRYLLTFTLRNDGSSRFSPDNRWGLFPSVAFAWRIKEESFLKNVKAISNLKLRLGYGITGQQDISNNDYPYLSRYVYSDNHARYILGNDTVTTARPSGYDANIKWEHTATYNIGLDYGFMNDRINGSIDIYSRKTYDLLNEIPVPAGTNFTNRILTNVGNLEDKGFEFSINGKPIVKKDLSWEVGFNLTYNENKITKLTNVKDSSYLGVVTGGISGGVGNTIQINSVGYPTNSFFVYEQVYDQNGKPIEGLYVDRNGDGQISEADRYRYKKPAPDAFMGFSSRLNYKKWDFSFSGRINVGNFVYNNVSSSQGIYNDLYATTYYLQNLNSNVKESNFMNAQYFSDYYVHNASFLRMDNITLGYNFDNVGINKLNIHLYATVQNAFVITKYNGLDPEVGNGIDNNIYPRPRTFVVGVNATF